MKVCARCKESKPESEFSKHTVRGVEGLRSHCKTCARKEYKKWNGRVNRKRDGEQRTDYSSINEAWLSSNYQVKCVLCGFDKSTKAIDCHHIDSGQKKNKYDSMGNWKKLTPDNFIKKLKETDFVFLCKNCHSMLHAGEIKLEV